MGSSFLSEILAGESRVVRDGLWVAAGQVTAAVARLVGLRVLTGLLSREVYGRSTLLLGITVLGSGIFLGPLLQAALRFYPEAGRDGRVNAFRALAGRLLWGSGAVAAALVLVGGWIWSRSAQQPASTTSLLLLVLVLLAEVLRLFEMNLLGAARRQRVWALWTAVDGWARPAAAVVAILVFGPTVEAILLGYAIGALGANLVFFPWIVRGDDVPAAAEDPWIKKLRGDLLRFALPLAPLALPAFVYNLGDRYVLGWINGDAAVGEYAAAYGLATMPFIFFAGIGLNTLRPVLFDAVVRGDRATERKTLLTWLCSFGLLSVAGAGLLGILAPLVVRLALAPEFRRAAELLPWIAAAGALQVFQQIFETRLYAHRRTRPIVTLQTVSAAVAIVLYLLLIPRMGSRGAAIATFLAAAVFAVSTAMLSGARALVPSAFRGGIDE